MAYAAKIISDSLGPSGRRLTTFEVTYPKFVHNELMTHRMLSRNTASSRAVPYSKNRQAVMSDPVMPVWWGKNQRGMQVREELTGDDLRYAQLDWLHGRDAAVRCADRLNESHTHKQIVNRVIEPWMWITTIVSATEWANFFALRCHPDAQPEIQKIAYMMRDLYFSSRPTTLNFHAWHLPYIDWDLDTKEHDTYDELCRISTARCARVSYLTHDGVRDTRKDLELFERLVTAVPPHMSPFEHVARALATDEPSGNFFGWYQYRKGFVNENTRVYTPE